MIVTFLGTGTSQGVPVPACSCKVCLSNNKYDKRLRSSLLLDDGNTVLSIDAGPDFRYQMLRENVKELNAVIITHSHRDHIAGLDDVRSFNYLQKKPMDIYATKYDQLEIKREFSYAFNNNYPGLPKYNLIDIDVDEFNVNGIKILPIIGMHHTSLVRAFRIGDFGYITDTNYLPVESMIKLDGCKVIVINALRKEPHPSHYNLQEALAIIDFINPEVAYLSHISHLMGFHDELQNEIPENVFVAYDGLKINIE